MMEAPSFFDGVYATDMVWLRGWIREDVELLLGKGMDAVFLVKDLFFGGELFLLSVSSCCFVCQGRWRGFVSG